MSIYEKIFTCRNCGNTTLCHWKSRMLNILPIENGSIEHLIHKAMAQTVCKYCTVCQYNTEHDEKLKWICFPKYLVLALSRFSYVFGKIVKNKTGILIQTHVSVDGAGYSLLGIIHHHGGSACSGHYTSTLFHDDIIFDCNDMMITESSNFTPIHSTTAYILVYRLS